MNIEDYEYNPLVEKVVNILMNKTQNYAPEFFRLQTNYYLTLIPSSLDIKINSPITGEIPINFYGINLAKSGYGKGHSTSILENEVIKGFKTQFRDSVFNVAAELNIEKEAANLTTFNGLSHEHNVTKLYTDFNSCGAYKFSFDSATSPAIKQLRNKLMLATVGSLNIIIDEIGHNLTSNSEALTTLLELYDKGQVKDKLIKNTSESTRFEDINGSTPANLLLFGTDSKLLDGSSVEDTFIEFLDSGYARRCFFAYSKEKVTKDDMTPDKLYELLTQSGFDKELSQINYNLNKLANINNCNWVINTSKEVDIKLLEYKLFCEKRAKDFPEHAEIQRAEMNHRYFKTLKIAGAYACLDNKTEISITNLEQAIKYAEESGKALAAILNREANYEKLAKFIADYDGQELTYVDINKHLPFFKGSSSHKNQLISMAIAWGYKNNIIIKKSFKDNIDFLAGECLTETNLEEIIFSYSTQMADNYENKLLSWNKFQNVCVRNSEEPLNFCNHASSTGRRTENDMQEGFNIIVLDVDGEVPLNTAKSLLKDYEYLIYTTKRHQVPDPTKDNKQFDRYRIILPINYIVKLSKDDFKTFMENFASWLPFKGLDTQTFQRSRKWASNEGFWVKNEGKLIDALPFIPKTSREQEFKKVQMTQESYDNLERWFLNHMESGNRNNMLLRYGYMLLDSGLPPDNALTNVLSFNNKLENPLSEEEIKSTIGSSLNRKILTEG